MKVKRLEIKNFRLLKDVTISLVEKLYSTLDELQRDLDEWMTYYNLERTHSGRYCYGKTPMQTFKESIILARQKLIGQVTPAA